MDISFKDDVAVKIIICASPLPKKSSLCLVAIIDLYKHKACTVQYSMAVLSDMSDMSGDTLSKACNINYFFS